MIMLKVSDERQLNQAISAKVNNLQVTDQAFDICKEAVDRTNESIAVNNNKQNAFDGLYKRMRLALQRKDMKKRKMLQEQITSQYMIREVPNDKAYELVRDTLV
ncbi:hypothetical protein [Companilactobacillus ginsenosidimutans]|uniref:Uncharacterized protein n=1 Tax=Companilactobacillus ginsenosidimutans TaxID=1007676 RepID=A0A0H4QZX4_9LACO|nr:hypothetical protein [Companilactobacillus ginsenosidimutans]AKP66995.1 hypothetical protein ABM34_05215 [Companilactobacillus ginsenosidimutans]